MTRISHDAGCAIARLRHATIACVCKLRAATGETLVESLVAILLLSLTTAMLLGSTLSAANMNATADQRSAELQEAQNVAEQGNGDATAIKVNVTSNGSSLGSYDASAYGSTDTLTAYTLTTTSTSARGFLGDFSTLWATVKTQKVTLQAALSDTNVGDAPTNIQTQELQKAWLKQETNYPALSATELSFSTIMSSGANTYVWKPVISSSGQVILCACTSNVTLGGVTGCPLLFVNGTYYKWTDAAGDSITTITDNGFDTSVLTAASSMWKAVGA